MPSDLKRLFGKRLATLRESKNLKQHQLARRIGRRDKYISDIETGRIYPRPQIMLALSEALEMPVSAFYFLRVWTTILSLCGKASTAWCQEAIQATS